MKKRLVGAFVLIGFGVVILPALLGGKGTDLSEEDSSVAPRLDSKVFVSKITPIGGATPQRPPEPEPVKQAATETPAQQKLPLNAPDQPAAQVAGIDSATEKAPPPKPQPKPSPVVDTDKPGWVVRVGTFAKSDNVERVVRRLQQAGFEPSTTRVKTQNGNVTRVWIGPYEKRVEAARMRTRVKQVTGGEGYIAAYP